MRHTFDQSMYGTLRKSAGHRTPKNANEPTHTQMGVVNPVEIAIASEIASANRTRPRRASKQAKPSQES